MTDLDTLDVALRVAAAFDQVGVDYFLGGSLAASLHGEPRATNDIDSSQRSPSRERDGSSMLSAATSPSISTCSEMR